MTFNEYKKDIIKRVEQNGLTVIATIPFTKSFAFLVRTSTNLEEEETKSNYSFWLSHLTCKDKERGGISLEYHNKCYRCESKPSKKTLNRAKFIARLMKI